MNIIVFKTMTQFEYFQEVDFAVAKFTITHARDSVIDYTNAFWHEPVVMVMKKPRPNMLLLFFGPLHWKVSFVVPIWGFAIKHL